MLQAAQQPKEMLPCLSPSIQLPYGCKNLNFAYFFVDSSKLQKDFKAREAGFDSFAGDASFCFLQKVSICLPLRLQLNSKLPFICSKVLFQKVFSLLSFCFSFN